MRRNTAAMVVGYGGRTILQAIYFIAIARGLGISGYGGFAAVVALVAVVSPFAGFGAGFIFVERVTHQPDVAPVLWANTVRVTVLSGLCLTVGILAVSHWVAPHSTSLLVISCIAVSDLILAALSNAAAQAFQAFEKLGMTAIFYIWQSGLRATGAVALILLPGRPHPAGWALMYLLTSIPTALAMCRYTTRQVGRSQADLALYRRAWRKGLYYSFGLAAQSIYNDVDKTMLGRMSTLDAAAIYIAAYRIIDIAFTPAKALLAATYPRFMKAGVDGVAASNKVARKIALSGVGYTCVASAALFLCAGVVPLALGSSYAPAVNALRGLSILGVLKMAHYMAADTLTGARHQGIRTAIQIFVAALNVALNLWLIPRYSWRGAVVTSIVSDGLLAVLLWSTVLHLRSRERRSPTMLAALSKSGMTL